MERSFGEKLKNLREDHDLTQKELGLRLHMTQRKISYLERGKYEPSMDDIRAICLFFQTSADFFLDLPGGLSYLKK